MDLKIGMLCPYYPWASGDMEPTHLGGVERHVRALSAALVKRGVSLTLITSGQKESALERDGIAVVCKRRRATMFGTPIFDWKGALSRDLDILHSHGTYPLLSDNSARVARRLGMQSVLTYHFDGLASGAVGKAMTRIYYKTLANRMREHGRIIVTSEGYLRSSHFLKTVRKEKIAIIPNGVDTKSFNPDIDPEPALSKFGLSPGYVLFVGRLVPYKGLRYLISAMKGVDRELVIVGDGPLRNELESMGKGKFLGFVTDVELGQLYSGASLTALSSINEGEAFGMMLIESMACGTPVVGTDLPGVADVASLGGRVAKRMDSGSMRNEIASLLETKTDRHQLARKAAELFSWDVIASKVISIYEKVLEKNDD